MTRALGAEGFGLIYLILSDRVVMLLCCKIRNACPSVGCNNCFSWTSPSSSGLELPFFLKRCCNASKCVTDRKMNYSVLILISYHELWTSKRSCRCLWVLACIISFKHDPAFLGATAVPFPNFFALPDWCVCLSEGWKLRSNLGRRVCYD